MINPKSTTGLILVVVLVLVSSSFFFSGICRRYRLVKVGRGEDRFNDIPRRVVKIMHLVFGQWTLLRSIRVNDLARITHFFAFWGTIAFVVGYVFFVFSSAFSAGFFL